MKSTVEKLTIKERDALARLHDTEGFNAFKKLMQLEIDAQAKDALEAPDMSIVMLSRGKAIMAKAAVAVIRNESKRLNKQL